MLLSQALWGFPCVSERLQGGCRVLVPFSYCLLRHVHHYSYCIFHHWLHFRTVFGLNDIFCSAKVNWSLVVGVDFHTALTTVLSMTWLKHWFRQLRGMCSRPLKRIEYMPFSPLLCSTFSWLVQRGIAISYMLPPSWRNSEDIDPSSVWQIVLHVNSIILDAEGKWDLSYVQRSVKSMFAQPYRWLPLSTATK